jgi:hypothetical protein
MGVVESVLSDTEHFLTKAMNSNVRRKGAMELLENRY